MMIFSSSVCYGSVSYAVRLLHYKYLVVCVTIEPVIIRQHRQWHPILDGQRQCQGLQDNEENGSAMGRTSCRESTSAAMRSARWCESHQFNGSCLARL